MKNLQKNVRQLQVIEMSEERVYSISNNDETFEVFSELFYLNIYTSSFLGVKVLF